jgi:hypothetical protein
MEWVRGLPTFAAPLNDRPLVASGFLDNLPVLSDFDGDNKIDQATLSSSGGFKSITLAFGKSSWSSLSFNSNVTDRGSLVSGDIDDDGDIDLVWISPDAGEYIAWLGDGGGHFAIGTHVKLDTDRIRALFGDQARRLGDGPNAAELTALSLRASFIVPGSNGYRPHISAQGSFRPIDIFDIDASRFSALQQRAPPPDSF